MTTIETTVKIDLEHVLNDIPENSLSWRDVMLYVHYVVTLKAINSEEAARGLIEFYQLAPEKITDIVRIERQVY